MFARVERFTTSPADMDDLLSTQQHTMGLARQLPGNMGGYVLCNRDAGKVMSVSYWETEEDRDAAESEFQAAQQNGEIEAYAVAVQRALSET